MKEKPECPCPRRPGRGNRAVPSQAAGETTGTPYPNAGRGFAGSGREPVGGRARPPTRSFLQTQAVRSTTPSAAAPSPRSRRPFGSGGNGEGHGCAGPALGVRPRPRRRLSAPRARLPLAVGLTAQHPRRAPPAPPGKMAPVEQLRHQPWRRARPSAILAPSSRTPPPRPARARIRGDSGGARRIGAAHCRPKASATRVSLLFGPVARAPQETPGWARARPGPAAVPRRCFGAGRRSGGDGAVPPAGARRGPGRAGSRPRALPAAARPSAPGRGCPQKRREGGNQEETETRSPPPPPSPPCPLPLPRRGVHFAEKKENAIHTQELPREKRNGGEGENRGEEIGKADFSSSPAVTPGPPCPLLAAPPRRPPLAGPRSLLPGSRRLRGAENTHSRTQLILNRLNQ